MTRAALLARVKTHIRAELASGDLAVNDIHNDSIYEFAQQHCTDVIHILKDTSHFSALVEVDTSFDFSTGSKALPSDYELALAVKVTTTSPSVTKRNCELLFNPAEFAKRDSANFVLTPDQDHPVVLIADDKAYIKPTTLTTGYLDYVKTHPTLGSSQGTEFDSMGDNVLVNLVLASYYGFLEEFDLQANHLKLAGAV